MRKLLTSPRGPSVALVLLMVLLSVATVTLPRTESIAADGSVAEGATGDVVGTDDPGGGLPAGEVAGGNVAGAAGPAAGARTGSATNLACKAGQNGGATDAGVTATKINLASTVVFSGIGGSFLADSPKAMQAVVNKVNRQGGICGRQLVLTVRDDGWDANRGLGFLRNFIESKDYFALPVVPSSEGLTAAINAGDIARSGVPVVGSDGMLIQQYKDPWVWPVATATVSTMRIMAKRAYERGARTFGIVYDSQYRFGIEGKDAYGDFVKSLPGAELKSSIGIRPGESGYGSEIQKFNGECASCDMVTLLLEPATAETWIAGKPVRGKVVTAGAQTLFNRRFAQNCRSACQGMEVWTGYTPPIDALASLPGVAEYVNDLKSIDPGVDTSNAFVEGAYLGMTVFVEALKRVGPNLTRARLKEVLNSMTYTSDLVSSLSWTSSRRHANSTAQAFELRYAGDTFSGFGNLQTGWVADPKVGG